MNSKLKKIIVYASAITILGGSIVAVSSCACSNQTVIVDEDKEFNDEVKKMNTSVINFINQMNTIGISLDTKDVVYAYLHLNAREISNDLLFEFGSSLTEAEVSRSFEKVMVKVQEAYMVSTKIEFVPNIASLVEDQVSKDELAKLDKLIVAYLGSTKDTRKQAANDLNKYIENYFSVKGYYKNVEPAVNTVILRTLNGIKIDGINSNYKIKISKSIVAPTSHDNCEKGIYDKTIYSEEYKTSKEILQEKLARISILNLKGNINKIISYINGKINKLIARINGIPTIQQVRDNLSDVQYKQTNSKTTTVQSTPSMPKAASNEINSGRVGSYVLGTSGDTRTTFTPNSGVSVASNGTTTYTDPNGTTHEVSNVTSDSTGVGEVSYPSNVKSSEVTSDPKYSSETTSYAENVRVDEQGNIWIYIDGEWYLVTPVAYGSEETSKVKSKN